MQKQPATVSLDFLNAVLAAKSAKPVEAPPIAPTAPNESRLFGTAWGMYNDGGIESTGRAGVWNDCVIRAVAIASGRPYIEVLSALEDIKQTLNVKGDSMSVGVKDSLVKLLCVRMGGTFRKVTCYDQATIGRWVVSMPGHLAALLDGVLNDTYESITEYQREQRLFLNYGYVFPDLGSENMVRRVKMLRNKAEDSTFTNEREAFIAKAAEIMVEHQITEAQLTDVVISREVDHLVITLDGKYGRIRRSGIGFIAKAMGAEMWWKSGTLKCCIAGTEALQGQVLQAWAMYDTWLINNYLNEPVPAGEDAKVFRGSYIEAYYNAVTTQLRKQRKAAMNQAAIDDDFSTALVVINEDADKLKEYMKAMKIRTVYNKRGHSGAGAAAGRAAGNAQFTKVVGA